MLSVTILYPRAPGARFDFDYYINVHMKRSAQLLGQHMLAISVEKGLDPGAPWPPARFFAICRFVCESRETYEAAFLSHAEELQSDIVNYTDVTPIIQIGEIFSL